MALIDVAELTKIFTRGEEKIYALNKVTFAIQSGEFVSITGPSGSGKSTLMYILGLLDSATGGRYLLDGVPTEKLSDNERARLRNQKIGFIFQNFHLLPRATAFRNVAMPLVYSGSYVRSISDSKIKEMAEEALQKVGLGDRMNHRPNELSGGQRQRVAIARALVNNPRILFADEPTGNLDQKIGLEILSLFQKLHVEGVTVVLVTHDAKVASAAERHIRMVDGEIVEDSNRAFA